MSAPTRTARSVVSDLGVMEREAGMAMATVASLADDELDRPTGCAGWTRADLVTHLIGGAHDLADLVGPASERPTVASTARELARALDAANRRLSAALSRLRHGAERETVEVPSYGEVSVYALPALRTAELVVHHHDLSTTWEWHEAAPDALVDAIEARVLRLRADPASPGLQVVAREGEEWTVGDGAHRIEGYYEELLPFLARGEVEPGLRCAGERPDLPSW
jgi:maleylpyruvate isomerase